MISVVIPTFNQESLVESTIKQLKDNVYTRLISEIIVVDAGSSDNTVKVSEQLGATVVHSIRKNSGTQFNLGAQHASGKILYFITPGSLVPKNFSNQIVSAVQHGCSAGAFSVEYHSKHWVLRCITKLSRMKRALARLEEQSLFVVKELFEKTGSFREDLFLFEDLELMKRLRRYSGFTILGSAITPCEQKYAGNNVLRSITADFIARIFYLRGYSHTTLLKLYYFLKGVKATSRKGATETLSPSYN